MIKVSVDEAVKRAEYYRWLVTRGDTMPGNDPITGRPRSRWISGSTAQQEAAGAYSALADYYEAIANA